jgi:hypothetical protein
MQSNGSDGSCRGPELLREPELWFEFDKAATIEVANLSRILVKSSALMFEVESVADAEVEEGLGWFVEVYEVFDPARTNFAASWISDNS